MLRAHWVPSKDLDVYVVVLARTCRIAEFSNLNAFYETGFEYAFVCVSDPALDRSKLPSWKTEGMLRGLHRINGKNPAHSSRRAGTRRIKMQEEILSRQDRRVYHKTF